MSFSEQVRDELSSAPPERDCCRRALLCGLLRTAGSYHLRGRGEIHVEVDLPAGPSARRVVELVRGMGGSCEIRTHRERRFGTGQRVDITLGADAATLGLLVASGVLTRSYAPKGRPPARVTGRGCCRAAYLRGAFVAAGTVASPRRPVHLEIRTHDAEAAVDVADLAATAGITLRVRERPTHSLAYTKRLETVEDLLALIGAHDAALRLAEGEVVSRAKEDANRQANAETANLRRQIIAARRQLAAIGTLRVAGALDRLPPDLLRAAELRAEHPELPLGELAAVPSPPLSKPTLAGRLRRLEQLADEVG
jgi:DNA-binding protein WhiA